MFGPIMQMSPRRFPHRFGVVGCKHTTEDLLRSLARHGLCADYVITISPEKAVQQNVAGYRDLRPFLTEKQIPYYTAANYSLKNDGDREAILAAKLDLVLVMGWQRLIPEWWLEQLKLGAFGMHGSFKPLPHGRGRSPMNWSLLQGRNYFFTHLFRYSPGIDDGPIVGQQVFELTPFDTCLTAHFKNQVAMARLCVQHLPELLEGTFAGQAQPTDVAPSYWPKREAEDGLIYWCDTTWEIYNLIRAVTRPFPGAFSYIDNNAENKLVIWRAIPFDSLLQYADVPCGTIVEVFFDGSFAVKTGDTTLLVQESEGPGLEAADVGRQFGCLDRARKTWDRLPH